MNGEKFLILAQLLSNLATPLNEDLNDTRGNKKSRVLLEYPTSTGFQWGHLKNGPYTANGGNGRVF